MTDKKWAVVHDGTTKYLGVITEGDVYSTVLGLSEAFELVLLRMPQQTRTGEVAIAMVVHSVPVGLATGPTFIRVSPSAVELFSDMDARDRETYEKFVEDARKGFLERRAKASGIVLPEG